MSGSRRPIVRIAAMVAPLAVLLALGLVIYLNLGNRKETEDSRTPDRRDMPGFHEAAEEAGIIFKMRDLPGEQGENFRGNLYDHGCGVAVADFEGSGREGIYFTNQFGRNA